MELIDKGYAISQIVQGEKEHGGVFESDSEHIKDFLRILPTVDPSSLVKRGRWEKGCHCMECSVCHGGYLGMPKTKYCPDCGARMQGD